MSNFWYDQRVLITGGNGFIGRRVVNKLKQNGCNITSPGSDEYDLREKGAAIELVQNKDIIIHLAANVGGLGYNREYPADVFYNNVAMSLNLIDAACKSNVKKFIGVGSIRSYSESAPQPFREEDIWYGPIKINNAAYGYAKRFMLAQSQFCYDQHGLPCVHLILTNTYGPEMRLDSRITGIAAMIKKFVEAKENNEEIVEIWGTGNVMRDFLYVDDAVDAVIFFAERCESYDILNIGSGEEISIRDVVNVLVKLCEYDGEVVWDSSKPEGESRSMVDISRATDLGFMPSTSFEDGVIKTLEWYRNVKQ